MPDQTPAAAPGPFGEPVRWHPERPRLRPVRLLIAWVIAAVAVAIAAWLLPGVALERTGAAFVVAAVIAVLNAILPPLLAALRLPFTLVAGFLLGLLGDALVLVLADAILPNDVHVSSFGTALLASLVITGASLVLEVVAGTNDDDEYTLRVVRRVARRQGAHERTDVPGIVFLEIDGLALPVLRDAMRDGSAPTMARWIAQDGYHLTEWETDLSSQTGASQAGILLGSNEDVPAFRWVEKETGRMMVCSSPADCAEIERRHATGVGLLTNGGASRGNLLSGEAEEAILTVSRTEAEKRANPGYRAFLANGFNVTRALVLFFWEVILEITAALRAARRDVRPRGHRGGVYPFMRAALCVIVRDLIVFGVLTDVMRGRPAVYATFSSYDEVAHHSGLERPDTMEALRKLDQQFGRIARALRYAPRPYEVVVLSDHGQTQGATFKQRNGYGLDELVERSLKAGHVAGYAGGDEQSAMVHHAVGEARGAPAKKSSKSDVSGREVVVLGSGNLGLVYLMDADRRLTLEEIDARHPELIRTLRAHPHIGWLLVRSAEHGAVVLGARGANHLAEGRVIGEDPLAPFSPTAARHLLRTDGFAHVADIMVGSFFDGSLEEGCAFEELISFHGGLGGPQTRAFILSPPTLPLPDEPIVGAAAVHGVLSGWRRLLQEPAGRPGVREPLAPAGAGRVAP
ncbi:MAG: phage holin family protein [Solirubrobacteraceae bacterium]